ncbi:TPA: hydrogenase maturation protease [bacterium]|nr:hydrogenase maturation protease [bacterium]
MKSILLIGYGNSTRMDDGVGWYIANKIEENFSNLVDVMKAYQLTVEMVDDIKDRDLVIFVDAHISNENDWFRSEEIKPDSSLGLITHIIKPSNLLAFCENLYHRHPKAYLYSVKGVEFDFGEELSEQTRKLADEAIQKIVNDIRDN